MIYNKITINKKGFFSPHPFLISHAAATLPCLWLSVSACLDMEDVFPFGLNGELEMHLEGGCACNFCNCFERRRLRKLAGETEDRSELRSACGELAL
jgi:hypothetical protein